MARTLIDLENQSQTIGDGKLLVGAATTGLPTAVTVSGDITLSNAGVAAIASAVIVNADINASAAIDFSKLAALTDGNILVGSAGNVVTSVNPSGDIDVSNAGVFSINLGVIVDADVNASAAIAGTKISPAFGAQAVSSSTSISTTGTGTITSAGTLTASNGLTVTTGTVSLPASSVSLSALAEAVIQADGGQAFTANQPMGGFILTGLGAGVSATDSVNKGQLDAAIAGLSWKDAADVATTAVLSGTMIADDGTPATGERAYNVSAMTINWFATQGPTTIDGVSLTNGMRILVKDESATSGPSAGEGRMYNGIYVRTSQDVWTRATDANLNPELDGAAVFVQQGTASADKGYTQTTDAAVIGGTATGSNIIWVVFTAVGGDATTLDGLDSLQFLRSDTSDSITGNSTLSVSSGSFIDLNAETALKIGGTSLTSTIAELNALGTFVRSEYAVGTTSTLVNGQVTVAGGQVAFTLQNTPIAGTVDVFVNGLLQDEHASGDYTISGSVVTFASAPLLGDKIIFKYRM